RQNERWCALLLFRWADKIHVFKFKLMSIPHMQTVHEPTGVGEQIFPWNFPLLKFVRKYCTIYNRANMLFASIWH
ncbi:hypothetical protein MKW92_026836, partial [Papaver armeniacum]